MGSNLDYQDLIDDSEGDFEADWSNETGTRSNVARNRDHRRAIEELREEKRLRSLLSDYDIDLD